MAVHEVDPDDYAAASATMGAVGDEARSAAAALAGALGASAGMAGADGPGELFAQRYNAAMAQAFQSAANIVNTAGNYATLLHATGENHARADAASTIGGGEDALPAAPEPQAFAAPTAPSASGGRQEPAAQFAQAWGLIQAHSGLVWPGGSEDQLRAAGSAWKAASDSTRAAGDRISVALALIGAQQAPETEAAAQRHEDLKAAFATVADGFAEVGSACTQYAQLAGETQDSLVGVLKEMLGDSSIMEGTGAVAGRVLMYANRAKEILQAFFGSAKRVADPLSGVSSRLGGVLVKPGTRSSEAAAGTSSASVLGARAEEAADSSGAVVDLPIRIRKQWSPDQKQAMRGKIEKFNQAVQDEEGYFVQEPFVVRNPNLTREYREEHPLPEGSPAKDVDHIRDLQAGGRDSMDNMHYLDPTVNRSFGSQLRSRMEDYPPNTKFGRVYPVDE